MSFITDFDPDDYESWMSHKSVSHTEPTPDVTFEPTREALLLEAAMRLAEAHANLRLIESILERVDEG